MQIQEPAYLKNIEKQLRNLLQSDSHLKVGKFMYTQTQCVLFSKKVYI